MSLIVPTVALPPPNSPVRLPVAAPAPVREPPPALAGGRRARRTRRPGCRNWNRRSACRPGRRPGSRRSPPRWRPGPASAKAASPGAAWSARRRHRAGLTARRTDPRPSRLGRALLRALLPAVLVILVILVILVTLAILAILTTLAVLVILVLLALTCSCPITHNGGRQRGAYGLRGWPGSRRRTGRSAR